MKYTNRSGLLPTFGTQNLAFAYSATAFFGVIFAVIVILRLDDTAFLSRGLSLYEMWILICGALGGGLGLRMSLPWFGTGRFAVTLGGIGLVTFISPIIAGTLALPLYGTMFGPFTLLLILIMSPILAVLWFGTLLGVDRMVAAWQRERDSIFGHQPRPPLVPVWLIRALRGAIGKPA